ncbi:MAG: FHA domain-containing protein [Rhodococcus sp. (in: high G+C Gram-positive bacteria)]
MTDSVLSYTDHGRTDEMVLIPDRSPIVIGRSSYADLSLPTDPDISRLHATVERIGIHWTITDDGLSRNGTFVNGTRLQGRQTLHPGDVIQVGESILTYHGEPGTDCGITHIGDTVDADIVLTPAQHTVLTELCRPFHDGTDHPIPASNRQIADALHLSTETVKTHLRALFSTFHIEDLPQNQKRSRLVTLALNNGVLDSPASSDL